MRISDWSSDVCSSDLIDVVDASGDIVRSHRHDNFVGAKECYPSDLPPSGMPGEWVFNVYLDGVLLATKTIEVSRTLNEASFYANPSRPYALGRPKDRKSVV